MTQLATLIQELALVVKESEKSHRMLASRMVPPDGLRQLMKEGATEASAERDAKRKQNGEHPPAKVVPVLEAMMEELRAMKRDREAILRSLE